MPNLSEWASEFLEERLSQAAATIRKPEQLGGELRSKLSEVINHLPGSAAREVERFLDAARQHAVALSDHLQSHNSINTASINASGTLMHVGCGVPVSLAFQHPLLFHATHQNETARKSVQRSLQTVAMKVSGRAVLAADSLEAAIVSVAKSEPETRKFIIPRCQAIQLPSGISLPDLLRSAGRTVIEVGSVEGWSIDGVRSELQDELSSCVLVTADRIVDGQIAEPFGSGDAAQGKSDIRRLMHVSRFIAPCDVNDLIAAPLPTLQHHSPDVLLLAPGDGLLGGPALGLIFGDKSRLQQISQSRDWCWLQADLTSQSSMILALETWADRATPEGSVLAMLETTHANLSDRAARLKNRLELAGFQVEIRSEDVNARLWQVGPWKIPSVELEVQPAADSNESTDAFVARLKHSNPLVMFKAEGTGVVLDLRWVAAALDAKLAKTIIGRVEQPVAVPDPELATP